MVHYARTICAQLDLCLGYGKASINLGLGRPDKRKVRIVCSTHICIRSDCLRYLRSTSTWGHKSMVLC